MGHTFCNIFTDIMDCVVKFEFWASSITPIIFQIIYLTQIKEVTQWIYGLNVAIPLICKGFIMGCFKSSAPLGSS